MRLIRPLLLIFALIGCRTEKEPPLPIPEEDLPAVLLDVHLAESAVQSVYSSNRDSLIQLYYAQICSIHDIERDDLDSTLARLRRNPERMLRVYNRMMELIAEKEAKVRRSD